MKYFFDLKQVIWLYLIILLAGCTKESNSYYPLNEGYTWEYQVTNYFSIMKDEGSATITNMHSRKLNGREVTPQEITSSNGTNYIQFISDNKGVTVYANQSPDMENPKVSENVSCIIPYPMNVGSTSNEKFTTTLLTKNILIPLTDSIESINETVDVPAGVFHNCLKVISFGKIKKQAFIYGIPTIKVKDISWYAPGVGLIKKIHEEESNIFIYGSGKLVMQLVSFKKK